MLPCDNILQTGGDEKARKFSETGVRLTSQQAEFL
jgi:hypothetical protein